MVSCFSLVNCLVALFVGFDCGVSCLTWFPVCGVVSG